MKAPKQILSVLAKERIFCIASHINPDGDAIGSSLALAMALESVGKKTFVYNRDQVPVQYLFLPGHERFIHDMGRIIRAKPVLVLLDCNNPERAAIEDYSFRCSVVIDHHETEPDWGEAKWVDSEAAATGLMIYRVIKGLGLKLTPAIATNLYAAIAVDTGTFRYGNTSADVLDTSAELVRAGADPHWISDSLYETWSPNRFRLLVMTLNTLEIKNGIAVTYITRDMFRRSGTNQDDTENFSNMTRMIETVAISANFREVRKGVWKASLRSKGDVNVARVAEQFGGGGHKNAAGFKIEVDLRSAKRLLMKAVENTLRK